MTTSSTSEQPAITCPSWCSSSIGEHIFEASQGSPVHHFRWIASAGSNGPAVCLTRTEDPDDVEVRFSIAVGDDLPYGLDDAEATALSMLEAVKLARS